MDFSGRYGKIYLKIIYRSKNRKIDGYTEKHHIIPKCLGGNNSKENIAILTAKEHYICHLLLVKMAQGKRETVKMMLAYQSMSTRRKQQRYSARSYSFFREKWHDNLKGRERNLSVEKKEKLRIRWLGSNNPSKNMSIETRQKMSKSAKLRKERYFLSPRIGAENGMFGKHHSLETRKKIKEGRSKNPPILRHTEEFKKSLSKRQSKPMIADGIEYESITKCAGTLNIPYETIRHRIKSRNFPDWNMK